MGRYRYVVKAELYPAAFNAGDDETAEAAVASIRLTGGTRGLATPSVRFGNEGQSPAKLSPEALDSPALQ